METGLYYLQSRYYDPELGRFINADGLEYLDKDNFNGLNLYAYCANNPVMNIDPSGEAWWQFWKWDWKEIARTIAAVIVVVVGVGALAIASAVTGGLAGVALGAMAAATGFGALTGGVSAIINGESVWGGILSGAIKGFATGAAIGLGIMTGGGAFGLVSGVFAGLGAAALNFAAGSLAYVVQNGSNSRDITWKGALGSGGLQLVTGLTAFATGFLMGGMGAFNLPKTKFSITSLRNMLGGIILKATLLWPLSALLSGLQKSELSGR